MPRPAKADLFLLLLALCTLLFLATLFDAAQRRDAAAPQLARLRATVATLALSDLSLFTEARYTRHLSQADRFAAFQDHPLALEHFPSGSLLPPPSLLSEAR
ncbi:MAG: hypothetical protein KDI68_04000 [Gammaproteobacteria bacterium]|nr:hypothetical protein [Gammaproteobacteria bacterium]